MAVSGVAALSECTATAPPSASSDIASVIRPDQVEALLAASPGSNFYDIRDVLVASRDGRPLTKDECAVVSAVIRSAQARFAVAEAARLRSIRDPLTFESPSFLICTAYSDDYTIGRMCEAANRLYAEKHGYCFESEVLSYAEMLEAVAPRAHPTWYKVLLLRRLLDQAVHRGIAWVMWIDADAMVIEHATRIQDIVRLAGARELIVAEDMNSGCLLNAGVLLVRACAWSVDLWADVWDDRRYWGVPFYEQAALTGVLKTRLEGLDTVRPFHSYVPGGPTGPKQFAHVCVLPTLLFNSNRWSSSTGLESSAQMRSQLDGCCPEDLAIGALDRQDRASYIFHPAGGSKLSSLIHVAADCGIALPPSAIPDDFNLFRRSHGRQPTAANVTARREAAARSSKPTAPVQEDDGIFPAFTFHE